jgi:uncharacterized repeat protein (TIGR02543 family)
MKRISSRAAARAFAALLIAAFLMGLSFAGTAVPVAVGDASELTAALNDAAVSGDTTTIYYEPGTSVIELSGTSATVPSNVTLDLGSSGGTLRVGSGTLSVYGVISGGAVEASGGTILRQSGSSITATVTVSGSGSVRGARVLSLENLDPASGESIVSVSYAGESGTDTSAFVARAAGGVIYPKMAGSNYSSYKTIERVTTDAGNIFRLGTKNTDTLSLAYTLTYEGLSGAALATTNPTSYTASDAAITLNNPTKDGFVFTGWTCLALSVTVPNDRMVIAEGTTGDLKFLANWEEDPLSGGRNGMGGSGGSGSASDDATTDDAATQQEAAAAADEATAADSAGTKRVRVASSSTKVMFTSDVDTVLPTLESVRGESFPWGLVLGGLFGLGVAVYIAVKLVERKKR